ncbi:MAG: ORF6N domain-containing protein [Bacteroidales bacterium]|nr:ORF6N domain-containing protein [Bacteroidales bacterium]
MEKPYNNAESNNLSANYEKLVSVTDIEKMIFTIRGVQVMIDHDLAMLYGVETKVLNQTVRRNIERFPTDFMFQLTQDEAVCSRSQIVTLNNRRGHNIKYLPYVFTENGISMLSGVLRSPTAIRVNIRIMRAFTAMRRFMMTNAMVFQRLESLENHQLLTDQRLDEVFKRIDADLQPKQGIFYDGQIFDAYTFVSDLVRSAKERIVLFDNYVDDTVLTVLDKRGENVSAIIITKAVSSKLELDFVKHNAQYRPIEVMEFDKVHDRFLCIDSTVYHIGASLKDLGKKWFAFSKMEMEAEEVVGRIR